MKFRQFANRSILPITALVLVGCDMITGAGDQKNNDAEAIGYACRVSQKAPENCMKENETQSPTAILKGWKAAERDIEDEVIDPSMGKKHGTGIKEMTAHSAPVAVESEGKAAAEKAVEKTAVAKGEKPTAAAAAKPGKGEAEKKADH
ncbi:MAG: hypothetical protein HY936_01640 [Nitrosomonadales bacterium]|nr:hypothetical protein [Nitrosomonadales bacterium]